MGSVVVFDLEGMGELKHAIDGVRPQEILVVQMVKEDA
jgi:hypothetical protein